MAAIEDAKDRWQAIRSKGRTKGIVALVIVVIVLVAIAAAAQGNASIVLLIVILAAGVLGAIALMLGKKQTGLSITPEWKPAERFEDDDEAEDGTTPAEPAATAADDAEPVRRLDAQILGSDLTKLGQVVNPKLAKSYAMGYLVLAGPEVTWEPSQASSSNGGEPLSIAPAEVSAVERTALWGSWALVRVSTTDGSEWCMRVPGSVDLAPAFAELGLTLQEV